MGNIKLFVSHSHDDKEIASALMNVIEAGFTWPEEDGILCTSDERYRPSVLSDPKPGKVSQHLKAHLESSARVLFLMTRNSLDSKWCMFELGGAWLRSEATLPLLAGVKSDEMPAALKGTAGVDITKPEELWEALKSLGKSMGWEVKSSAAVKQHLRNLAEIAQRSVGNK